MKVHIIGEDRRTNNLRKIYKEEIVDLENAEVIICPIPFTRDSKKINSTEIYIEDFMRKIKGKTLVTGAVNKDVTDKIYENNINLIDLIQYEEFSVKNAIATSEGAIKKAIEMTEFTLNNSNILILGYGRIGRCLARNLEGFGANIYCEARKKKDIAIINSMGYNCVELENIDEILPKMNIIFNTIPSIVLDEKKVMLLDRNACVIDLASSPGGVDFEALSKQKINSNWYLSVPSKDSPYTAALYIKETLEDILKG